MKVLVVGGGGREHALAWKLKQSPAISRIFCAPGNAGTEELGDNVPIRANDLAALLKFAKQNAINLTVVGPDDPLAAGIVDLFEREGLRIFGPRKSAAQLESSKIFAKQLMQQQGIPTAAAGTFDDADAARHFCESARLPIVIKADGLALGKGVIIASSREEALEAIEEMMTRGRFSDAGRRIVIEEFLAGSECSVHALISGGRFQMLATARDHKRAFDGDKGPNTGGMGAISPADTWSDELQSQFDRAVMRPLLAGLTSRGIDFRGLLFPGLMINQSGPQVLEFNCRFGDPETQAILPRLRSDLLELIDATIDGELDRATSEWDDRVAVTVVLASGGYPENYETGHEISGLEEAAKLSNVLIFHAGTQRKNGRVVTAGGRVLAVTALGDSTEVARRLAY
ncbi:MAG: phosphoribosylamine--glycine ligase, partial [Chthoniobacterales bacterium]